MTYLAQSSSTRVSKQKINHNRTFRRLVLGFFNFPLHKNGNDEMTTANSNHRTIRGWHATTTLSIC